MITIDQVYENIRNKVYDNPNLYPSLHDYTRKKDYLEAQKQWRVKNGECTQQFRVDAIEATGLKACAKREEAFNFAWQEGHACGLSDVLNYLTQVAELVT